MEETAEIVGKSSLHKNVHNHNRYRYLSSYGGSSSVRRFLFFVSCFGLYALVALTYAWLAFPPHIGRTYHVSSSSLGCREDNEGSWSVGVYYGDSPFTLKPIETVSLWNLPSVTDHSRVHECVIIIAFFWWFLWVMGDRLMYGGTRVQHGLWLTLF